MAADSATPLIEKLRNATARHTDLNVALAEGLPATPCVSGPDTGRWVLCYRKVPST